MNTRKSRENPTRDSLELIIAEQAEIIANQAEQIKRLAYAVGQFRELMKGGDNEHKGN